jgi:hypothetical protein
MKRAESFTFANDVVVSTRPLGNPSGSIPSISGWLDERLRNPSAMGGPKPQSGVAHLYTNHRER